MRMRKKSERLQLLKGVGSWIGCILGVPLYIAEFMRFFPSCENMGRSVAMWNPIGLFYLVRV